MHTDFSETAKRARVRIPVPPLDVELIRERSASRGMRERLRQLAVSAAISLGIVGAAAALASGVSSGVRIWLFGDTGAVAIHSFAVTKEPMAADMRSIVSRAAFPVILPVGLPDGVRLTGVAYTPAERPTFIDVQYSKPHTALHFGVTIIRTDALETNRAQLPPGESWSIGNMYHWRIGQETVLAMKRFMPQAGALRIHDAMLHASPHSSLAATYALLPRVMVLQKVNSQVAEAAERIAPSGTNVVVADWDMRLIPRLVANGEPLRDSRTTYLTNIPQVHGQPDYRHATLHWPKAIAIPADGVRVVAVALRRSHTGPNCDCSILVNDSNGKYTVWKIDQRTLTVTKI